MSGIFQWRPELNRSVDYGWTYLLANSSPQWVSPYTLLHLLAWGWNGGSFWWGTHSAESVLAPPTHPHRMRNADKRAPPIGPSHWFWDGHVTWAEPIRVFSETSLPLWWVSSVLSDMWGWGGWYAPRLLHGWSHLEKWREMHAWWHSLGLRPRISSILGHLRYLTQSVLFFSSVLLELGFCHLQLLKQLSFISC